jgi:hypothetical protein
MFYIESFFFYKDFYKIKTSFVLDAKNKKKQNDKESQISKNKSRTNGRIGIENIPFPSDSLKPLCEPLRASLFLRGET